MSLRTSWVARFLGLAAIVALLACGSGGGSSAAPPTLDGIYQSTGAFSWTAFHDGSYTFWSSSAACNGDKPAATCAQTGSFTFDPDTSVLTMTEAASGETWSASLSNIATGAESASLNSVRIQDLPSGSSLSGPSTSLGGSMSSLTTGSQSLISGYSAQPLANGTNTELAANWKAIIYLTCQILTGGTDPLPEKPMPPPPPPITMSCSGKS
jgi:hypothetical protein